jgi:glutathione peroxidase
MSIRHALAASAALTLLSAAATAPARPGISRVKPANLPPTAFDQAATRIDGKPSPLAVYRGQALLIVNTASKCGFTPQYKGLQALHEKYQKKGLAVLGFPSNDFLAQEPGSNAEIAAFCDREFHVTFPLFAKVAVGGDAPAPLYRFLLADADSRGFAGAVSWNFEKFLVGRDGHVVGRWKSTVAPEAPALVQAIEQALAPK